MPIPTAEPGNPLSAYPQLVNVIQNEVQKARKQIQQIKAVTYWNIGGFIEKYLLNNQSRASYGKHFLAGLSQDLNIDGRTLQQAVKFHRSFPTPTARSELAWTHYRELLKIPDSKMRQQLFEKAGKKGMTTRVLREEIKRLKIQKAAAQAPAQLLASPPGKMDTYRLNTPAGVALQPGCRMVDCGFDFWRQIPAEGLDALKDGTIVESRAYKSGFQLTESTRVENDLYTYRAVLDYVIDGDTVVMQIDLGFRSFSRQKLRLRGIDTPELPAPEGQEAKSFVERRLKAAKTITIKTYRKDKYGRFLADIFLGEKQDFLNQKLLDKKLATVYNK